MFRFAQVFFSAARPMMTHELQNRALNEATLLAFGITLLPSAGMFALLKYLRPTENQNNLSTNTSIEKENRTEEIENNLVRYSGP